jgi:hypothetical protein
MISPAILHRRKQPGMSPRILLSATTRGIEGTHVDHTLPTMTNHTLPPINNFQTKGSLNTNSTVNAVSALGEAKLADMLEAAFMCTFPGFSHCMPIKDAAINVLDSPAHQEYRQRETQVKELRISPHHKQYLVS